MSDKIDKNEFDDSSDDYLDDEEFFKRNMKYAGFLEEMNLGEGSGEKRMRKEKEEEEENMEEDYEKRPRELKEAPEHYLPTIQEDGTMRFAKKQKIDKEAEAKEREEAKAEAKKKELTKREKKELKRKAKKKQQESSSEEEKEEEKEKEDEVLLNDTAEPIPKTPEELAKEKEEHYKEAMTKIAVNSEIILENPEKNVVRHRNEVSPLNEIVTYLKDEDPRIRLISMLSLMKVFNDILPNYPIHLASKEEKEGQISKEVRRMRQYEESLMTFYQSYVKTLIKVSKSGKNNSQEKTVAIKCLCNLLQNHYQFNLSDTLCKAVVPFITNSDPAINSLVSECFKQVFRGDAQGSITFSIAQQLAGVVKARNFKVPEVSIQVLYYLPLKQALSETDELGERSKRKKKTSEADRILMEGEGPDPDVYKAFQKDTLQEVLLTYFRILKLENNRKLLHVVLQGLAHFGHLLNSKIITDLLTLLKGVMEMSDLPMTSVLMCVLASLRLNKIVSTVINMDNSDFITKLYAIRYDFLLPQNFKLIPDYLECIDLSFLDRKELLQERVAAYVKALTTLALHLPTKYAMACISLARALVIRYPAFSSLVENEEGRRISGVFNVRGDAPEQVNAHAATLWECCIIGKSYDPNVVAFIKELEDGKSMRVDQNWREMLKKDYTHPIFTSKGVTKKKEVDEDDIDEMIDRAFESADEEEGMEEE